MKFNEQDIQILLKSLHFIAPKNIPLSGICDLYYGTYITILIKNKKIHISFQDRQKDYFELTVAFETTLDFSSFIIQRDILRSFCMYFKKYAFDNFKIDLHVAISEHVTAHGVISSVHLLHTNMVSLINQKRISQGFTNDDAPPDETPKKVLAPN